MIRRVRRKLRLISYHSAPRRRTRWTRLQEILLVVSLVLALPAALVCDALVARTAVVEETIGGLSGDRRGPVSATAWSPEGATPWVDGVPFGEWTLRVMEEQRGWPVVSSRRRLPAELLINDFDKAASAQLVTLDDDDPIRLAIEAAITAPEHRDVLAAWRDREHPEAERFWFRSALGAMVWWVMLSVASSALVGFLRVATALAWDRSSSREAALRAQGRCVDCGYDLRGLEFNARCPECGSLIE